MKYRKRPVEIEAMQLNDHNVYEVYSFIKGEPNLQNHISQCKWNDYEDMVRKEGLKLKTLESDGETQTAAMGDFIIKGVKGEFYPCKPDIFELTYEKVE